MGAAGIAVFVTRGAGLALLAFCIPVLLPNGLFALDVLLAALGLLRGVALVLLVVTHLRNSSGGSGCDPCGLTVGSGSPLAPPHGAARTLAQSRLAQWRGRVKISKRRKLRLPERAVHQQVDRKKCVPFRVGGSLSGGASQP